MKKFWITIGVLAVVGVIIGGGLYLAFLVQMSTIGGLTRNYFLTLGAPAGTLTTEANPAYTTSAAGAAPGSAVAAAPAAADWPSYKPHDRESRTQAPGNGTRVVRTRRF